MWTISQEPVPLSNRAVHNINRGVGGIACEDKGNIWTERRGRTPQYKRPNPRGEPNVKVPFTSSHAYNPSGDAPFVNREEEGCAICVPSSMQRNASLTGAETQQHHSRTMCPYATSCDKRMTGRTKWEPWGSLVSNSGKSKMAYRNWRKYSGLNQPTFS